MIAVLGMLVIGICAMPWRAEAFEHVIHELVTDKSIPDCQQSAVIDTIRNKFDYAAVSVIGSPTVLGSIDKITEVRTSKNDKSPYLRRYCEARAVLGDGRTTTLYYLLEQEAGFVGVTWNVEYCLLGRDPWLIHDGRCHAVRYRWW